jgi:hypothetical protein
MLPVMHPFKKKREIVTYGHVFLLIGTPQKLLIFRGALKIQSSSIVDSFLGGNIGHIDITSQKRTQPEF